MVHSLTRRGQGSYSSNAMLVHQTNQFTLGEIVWWASVMLRDFQLEIVRSDQLNWQYAESALYLFDIPALSFDQIFLYSMAGYRQPWHYGSEASRYWLCARPREVFVTQSENCLGNLELTRRQKLQYDIT